MAKKAKIGDVSAAGTIVEIVSSSGANRAERVIFLCSHCGGRSNPVRASRFYSSTGEDRARSCRCLKKRYVAKKMDQAIAALGAEHREVVAQEAEAAGLGSGMTLAIEWGAKNNVWLRYAVSNLRRVWAASFVSNLNVVQRTKFWLTATRRGLRAAARLMGWNLAEAIAVFRAVKRATATLTAAARKAAHVAGYRVKELVKDQSEYPAHILGSKARKDVDITWALRSIESQTVTDEIGLAALAKEERTNILRMQRRERFMDKLKAGLVDTYERVDIRISNRASCWPSRFTHEAIAA